MNGPDQTGAERYFRERMKDPAYRAAYEKASSHLRTIDHVGDTTVTPAAVLAAELAGFFTDDETEFVIETFHASEEVVSAPPVQAPRGGIAWVKKPEWVDDAD